MAGICRRYSFLLKYAVLAAFQMVFLRLLKCLYPEENYLQLIQMEFTGSDPLNHVYFFSVGVLLIFFSMEIYILFQSIQEVFIRYCYLYSRISGNRRKKLAVFVLKRIVISALLCTSIHLCSGFFLLCLENGKCVLSAAKLNTVVFLLYLEGLHLLTLLMWGGFIVIMNTVKVRRQYIWMTVCLVLCIVPVVQNRFITALFLPFDQNVLWYQQWQLKCLLVIITSFLQYYLLAADFYCPFGNNRRE